MKKDNNFLFLIYTSVYNETEGGNLMLHYLQKLLVSQECNAEISIIGRKEHILYSSKIEYWLKKMFFFIKGVFYRVVYFFAKKGIFLKSKKRILAKKTLKARRKKKYCKNNRTIVVYPEVIRKNPLGAQNVVRWLLNKPGFFVKRNPKYKKSDLFFCFQKVFNDQLFNPDENMLTLFYVKKNVFEQTNFEERSGNCYIIRKGENRDDLPKVLDGPVIDNLPDKEVAQIFNRYEYCISYDPYTFYSQYAAMCGCISVVEPLQGIEKDEWQPKKELSYGIAYGRTPAEIQYAKNTKCKMEEHLASIEQENIKQVQNFVSICNQKFR
ncbi:MAG: hypothetical protein LBR75_04870 [Prevotellaceae bacterium]|jgi:hypothetical protein|nr:hypothetical protein [Prevotellaceae bacterium]